MWPRFLWVETKKGTCNGTRGRTRTGTLLLATDFESVVSTNFTTLASEAEESYLRRLHSIVESRSQYK